ncbi:MAG: KAP family P-loop domain protein, partial [Candidatus Electrothrix sp. ATG2]|nr:KAP family P-loop domain protein [Candidatus Electrothrix sp. ATG2]
MWSDTESEKDYLNFGEVSELTIDILTSKGMLPVSIGVFGNWGAGKSSLLKLIEKQLEDKQQEWIVVKFDAWLYQGYDDARAALLEIIAKKLTKVAEGDDGLKEKTKNLLGRIDKLRVFGLAAEGAALLAGIPTWGILSRSINAFGDASDGIQDQKEQKNLSKTSEQAKKQVTALIKPEDKKSPSQQIDAFRDEYEKILEKIGKPLVVIIDNLDRCLPSNAIHTLEAIRL